MENYRDVLFIFKIDWLDLIKTKQIDYLQVNKFR